MSGHSLFFVHNKEMKILLLLAFFVSCSHTPKKHYPPDGLVTVDTALDHIRASYLKGCVDTYHSLKIPKIFEYCRDQAQKHRDDVQELIERDTE